MLYIRTDMNNMIATGHVMRCLAIADEAKEQGEQVTFLLADEQAVELVEQKGYQTIVLHTSWYDMESELPQLLQVVEKKRIEKILIDSYLVTEKYLQILTSYVKTIYIDDRNAFIYPVSGLICYANYWKKFNYFDRYKETKLFLGTEYVPLRKVFFQCGNKEIRNKVEELLILSGGTDPYEILKGILEKVNKSEYRCINIICGRYYTAYEDMKEEYQAFDNVHIYQDVSDIEKYMKTADLAISAGGSTLYELCACGTPTISFSFVDNQLDNVKQFQEDAIIDYAGDARYENVVENILLNLEKYDDVLFRQQRSQKMIDIIDGNGSSRIVEALKNI